LTVQLMHPNRLANLIETRSMALEFFVLNGPFLFGLCGDDDPVMETIARSYSLPCRQGIRYHALNVGTALNLRQDQTAVAGNAIIIIIFVMVVVVVGMVVVFSMIVVVEFVVVVVVVGGRMMMMMMMRRTHTTAFREGVPGIVRIHVQEYSMGNSGIVSQHPRGHVRNRMMQGLTPFVPRRRRRTTITITITIIIGSG
jgi:hypothetical protein